MQSRACCSVSILSTQSNTLGGGSPSPDDTPDARHAERVPRESGTEPEDREHATLCRLLVLGERARHLLELLPQRVPLRAGDLLDRGLERLHGLAGYLDVDLLRAAQAVHPGRVLRRTPRGADDVEGAFLVQAG